MVELFATEKLKKILDVAKPFLEEEIVPNEMRWLGSDYFDIEDEINSKRRRAKDLGLWLPHFPEDEGGAGLSLVEFAQLSELLGRSPFGHLILNCQAPDIGNSELLHAFGNEKQKNDFLRPLLRGEIRSCFAMTEPELPGSNPVLLNATAIKESDGYVINGHKWFTTAADGAAFTIVMAVTNPDAPSLHQRASMIIVPMDNPGVEFVRNIPIMGEKGSGYLSHAELRFNNCRVPQENLIDKEGQGFALAQERLGPGRIHHCMRWVGIASRAFEMLCSRAASRDVAPNKKLSEQQTIQHWIAELNASITASRLMVLHTAHAMQKHGQRAVKEEISTIKFFVANVLMEVLDKAIQVHGALGITDDTLLSFWYRHERGSRIYDGPDEVHKTALARRILKPYQLKDDSG